MKNASLKDIAQRTGLSVSGVSLALRGSGKIAAATRQRVQEVADELGYVPRPALAAAASSRFRGRKKSDIEQLAYIWSTPEDERAAEQAEVLFELLAAEGLRKGFQISNYPCHAATVAALLRRLYQQGVVGVVLGPWLGEVPPQCPEWKYFAIIRAGGTAGGLPVHVVEEDLFGSATFVVKKAFACGYQRLGLAPMSHEPRIHADDRRLGGLVSACIAATGEYPQVPPLLTPMADKQSFVAWVKKYQPDCVIAFHTGAYYWLGEIGIRVPEDMGFIALHTRLDPSQIRICGMEVIFESTAEVTLELMNTAYQIGDRGLTSAIRRTFVESHWREGETIRKLVG